MKGNMIAIGAAAALLLVSSSAIAAREGDSDIPFARQAPGLRIVPNALLTIDQNRDTVVERIVAQWGETLAQSPSAVRIEELRTMLLAMRADHLLAASLVGNLEGLRNVLANAIVSAAEVKPGLLQAKAIGDSADDLVYTPVTPCRIVDTRNVAGPFAAGGEARNYHAFVTSGTFASQGGASSNCGIAVNPAAAVLNITTIGGGGFLVAWPYNTPQPLTATLIPGGLVANGATVPLCQPNCAAEFSVFTYGAQVVIDIVGYFRRPANYSGNTVIGATAVVGGGSTNTASASYSVVSGGFGNTANGYGSMVAGGENNVASSVYGFIAGGYQNTVANTAYDSFAAGRYANADQPQCFLFANWAAIPSPRPSCLGLSNVARFILDRGMSVDYHSIRSDGGGTRWVYIGDSISGQTIATWTGGFLSDGGTWTNFSDVAGKTDFQTVNTKDILAQVVRLPIQSWRYRAENADIRHLGPVAQDFRSAFGLGNDEKHIGTVDADGVALAAIQGLHELLREKDARIEAQQHRLDEFERRMAEMESRRP